MKFLIDVPDALHEELIKRAIFRGLQREDPRKAWTGRERREFIKAGLACLLDDERKKVMQ